jgi:hypothetical protein
MCSTRCAASHDLKKGARITGTQRDKLAIDLKKKYEKGASIRALAEQTGRSYGFVHRVLSETGVPLRGRGGRDGLCPGFRWPAGLAGGDRAAAVGPGRPPGSRAPSLRRREGRRPDHRTPTHAAAPRAGRTTGTALKQRLPQGLSTGVSTAWGQGPTRSAVSVTLARWLTCGPTQCPVHPAPRGRSRYSRSGWRRGKPPTSPGPWCPPGTAERPTTAHSSQTRCGYGN